MNPKRQKIVYIFEDKLCRFCAKSCGNKCYDIFESMLLYKQKNIEFEELISFVLDLKVQSGDGKSPLICDGCKIKLIDFYDFKSQCRKERIEENADLEVTQIKNSFSPSPSPPPVPPPVTRKLPPPATPKLPTSIQPTLNRTLFVEPRTVRRQNDKSINIPVDPEVKSVMVLFISILTRENLWMEHDRKFNKWKGQLYSNTSQKCTIPRKYGEECGVSLHSFYMYLAHVIIYHLLESVCPQCKIPFVGTSNLADHFRNKCLSKSKALKHEKYRQSILQPCSP